jgi:hypothetical protein
MVRCRNGTLRTHSFLCLGSLVGLWWSLPARAEETTKARIEHPVPQLQLPYTLAQLGVGLLAMPAASVCLSPGSCTKGDTSLELDFWQMYRANSLFAVGAGASVAIQPNTDPPASASGVSRSHTRSYFLVEAQGRYYLIRSLPFEAWAGATVGGIIVSDRYTIEGGDKPTAAIIGPRASILRTEGLTMGAIVGAHWTIAPNWAVGFSVRYLRWFLPHTAATTVFLDRATLTDQQSAVNFGISCAYRIAL